MSLADGHPVAGFLTARGVSYEDPVDGTHNNKSSTSLGSCYSGRRKSYGQRKLVPYENIIWVENASNSRDSTLVDMTFADPKSPKSDKYRLSSMRLKIQNPGENAKNDLGSKSANGNTLDPNLSISEGRPSTNSTSRLVADEAELETTDTVSPLGNDASVADNVSVVDYIMARAYHNCKREKRLLVLINSHSGQGKALSLYNNYGAPFFAAARCQTEVIVTTGRHHATEVAEQMDVTAYDAIVCCSGDGIPHEVVNGLARNSNPANSTNGVDPLKSMPICQFPCGSGNSLCMSLNGSPSTTLAALNIIKGKPMPVDLMCMTQGSTKSLSFLSQTYGLVADCDLGTENLRWMGGSRFALGAIYRALARTVYPCEVAIKYSHRTKDEVAKHYSDSTLALQSLSNSNSSRTHSSSLSSGPGTATSMSVFDRLKHGTINDPTPSDWHTQTLDDLNFFYVGKMPWMSADALVFPASLPSDGTLDFVTWDAKIGRFKCVDLLLQVEKGHHVHNDNVHYAKIEAYRLYPKIRSGYLSIDGESFPFEPFQVEVLKSAGSFLSSTGAYAETNYDTNR